VRTTPIREAVDELAAWLREASARYVKFTALQGLSGVSCNHLQRNGFEVRTGYNKGGVGVEFVVGKERYATAVVDGPSPLEMLRTLCLDLAGLLRVATSGSLRVGPDQAKMTLAAVLAPLRVEAAQAPPPPKENPQARRPSIEDLDRIFAGRRGASPGPSPFGNPIGGVPPIFTYTYAPPPPPPPPLIQGKPWWQVLGVPETAAPDVVRRAYLGRVKEAHPDKGGDAQAFGAVQKAYEVAQALGRAK